MFAYQNVLRRPPAEQPSLGVCCSMAPAGLLGLSPPPPSALPYPESSLPSSQPGSRGLACPHTLASSLSSIGLCAFISAWTRANKALLPLCSHVSSPHRADVPLQQQSTRFPARVHGFMHVASGAFHPISPRFFLSTDSLLHGSSDQVPPNSSSCSRCPSWLLWPRGGSPAG